MLKYFVAVALAALAFRTPIPAQACTGTALEGVVRDSTSALLPGAQVLLDEHTSVLSGPEGRFRFPCVPDGKHTLTATTPGFAPYVVHFTAPRSGDLTFRLTPRTEASVTVDADDDAQVPAPGGTNGLIVSGKQLQSLADDPDDLLRELQQLSAASGGSPGGATISVDGFQDSSTLPPKDSIAYVNVSPDLFSAEYREPPFGGGRVEIYTKPGAKNFHGALFGTNSSSWMNARDPFSQGNSKVGKQRYGFDFSGPVRKVGSNFALNLEHRTIDETVTVNAFTPGPNGAAVNTFDTVPIPQHLWVGNARVDWQFGPKDFAFVSFAANASHYENLGVGGQTLRKAGYQSGAPDYTIRASNVTTFSPTLVHESRVSYEFYHQIQVPNSTGPSLQVSGYFTGGGSPVGNTRDNRSLGEFDDDIIVTTKKHLIKTGVQLQLAHRLSQVLANFNGTYVFTTLAQYEAAQSSSGGTAFEFNNVTGNPTVAVDQVRLAGFYQDNVKLSSKWNVFYGLRYFLETDPANYNSIGPRGGFSYTPDKKATWVLKAHSGVFNGQYSASDAQELHREDGVERITSLVYNPVFGNPFARATPIHALRTLAPGFNNAVYLYAEFNVSKDLPKGFNINAEEVVIPFINGARTININQPIASTSGQAVNPFSPRPYGPNLNILQARRDGEGGGHGEFFSISNFRQKRVQFFLGLLHLNVHDNSNDDLFYQPQSAYTDAGEDALRSNQGQWQTFGNASISLPWKLALSGNGYASGGQPFNITTGSDNNGDGNFNDRPQFAPPGSVADGVTIIATPFGVLTNAGAIVNGIPVAPIQRDLGRLPWSFHLDANLQRAFVLTKNKKDAHQQTLTANIRSANFINHTNVLTEGSVPGAPQFLQPVSTDNARRVEFGLRYSF